MTTNVQFLYNNKSIESYSCDLFNKYRYIFVYIFSIIIYGCNNDGQYLNHREGVKFVGSAACVKCHEDVAQDYFQTGMGRSFYRPKRLEAIESFGPVVYDPHSDFFYRAFWDGDSMFIEEYRLDNQDTVHRRREKVDYVVGSGRQTRSYLHERGGFVFEAPITWYVVEKKWDLSPGYENGANSRFSRPIGVECMNCHNAFSEHVPGTANKYSHVPLGIDCERCHGPGEEHVRRMENDQTVDVGREIDYSIVNPAKLPPELGFDVCQQCHLSGLSVPKSDKRFIPGMRLSDFYEVFLIPDADPEKFGISSHAARLRQSKCYSSGKLTCTACHDPHKSTSQSPAESYRAACMACHADCKLELSQRAAKQDRCAECHMRKGGAADIPHVRFTDHYIRVLKTDTLAPKTLEYVELLCATGASPDAETVARANLMYYERIAQRSEMLEKAIAGLKNPFDKGKALFYAGRWDDAEKAMLTAAESEPRRAECRFYLGEIFKAAGKYERAAEEYARAFALNEHLSEAAANQAHALLKARPGDEGALIQARELFSRAAKIKPGDASVHAGVAFAELNLKNLDAARAAVERALALDPDLAVGRENAAYIALLSGQKDRARAHLKHLAEKHPGHPGLNRLRAALR